MEQPVFNLDGFVMLFKARLGDMGVRQAADEIGISSATVSRIASGKAPELDSFGKCCEWIGVTPTSFFPRILERSESPVAQVRRMVLSELGLDGKTAAAIAQIISVATMKTDTAKPSLALPPGQATTDLRQEGE